MSSICVKCVSGSLLPGKPLGYVERIADCSTYIAQSASNADPTKAIISFTDVFGIEFKNNRIVADLIAQQTGYTVFVPDVSTPCTEEPPPSFPPPLAPLI